VDNDFNAAITCQMDTAVLMNPDWLHDAIGAVLDLHRTDRGNGPDPDGRCFECMEVVPCPTVRAIAEALGAELPAASSVDGRAGQMTTPDPRYLNLFRRIARTVEPKLQEIREHRLTGVAPANEQVALIAVAAVLAERQPPGPAVTRDELVDLIFNSYHLDIGPLVDRDPYGADDEYAAELHALAADMDTARKAARGVFATPQVFGMEDGCQCSHPFGHHYKAEADWPMRCVHAACGCVRFRYRSPREDELDRSYDLAADALGVEPGTPEHDNEED
jgi:hypothetical protein